MRHYIQIFIMLGLFVLVPVKSWALEQGFAELAEKLMPAVVNISISSTVNRGSADILEGSPFQDFFEEFFDQYGQPNNRQTPPKERRVSSLGSGFVINPTGTIITNNHVIEHADKITVKFSNGDSYEARLIGRDPKTDLAVLKIEANKPLPHVSFGDSHDARVGDWVIAIGNPFGLGGSLSAGVISAINRDINAGPYDSFIQTDAAINRGNSGGPLFNLQGEVIGVNTAIISPTGGSVGIGFAIPADMVSKVVTQLVKYGETRRGWLGVRIQAVTEELAESLGMKKPRGALISEVIPKGPAETGGLKQGDVILTFNKQEIAEMRDLPRIVAETKVNERVKVELLRRGKIVKKTVKIGRLREPIADRRKPSTPSGKDEDTMLLGMQLRSLTDKSRADAGMEEGEQGVLITKVERNSSASLAGVQPGHIITEVDQMKVAAPQDVAKHIKKATADGKKSVLMLLRTRNGLRFIALRLDGSHSG